MSLGGDNVPGKGSRFGFLTRKVSDGGSNMLKKRPCGLIEGML